jgi:hypothetical protein
MNPNLIPTVIVNKNGVTTTVHKKPLDPSTTGTGLPAAHLSPTTGLTEAQRSNMISQMHSRLETIEHHKDAIRDLLLTYPDNAVTAMHDYIMTDAPDNREQRHRTAFLRILSDPRHHDTGSTIHEYLTFRAALQPTASNINDGLALIRALHGYQQLPVMDSYGDADQETQEQITALLTVTQPLYKRYREHQSYILSVATTSGTHSWDQPPVMPDPLEVGLPLEVKDDIRLIGDDLINLIIERPENADAISRTIIKDGISDGALLREKLDSKTPALRDGIL